MSFRVKLALVFAALAVITNCIVMGFVFVLTSSYIQHHFMDQVLARANLLSTAMGDYIMEDELDSVIALSIQTISTEEIAAVRLETPSGEEIFSVGDFGGSDTTPLSMIQTSNFDELVKDPHYGLLVEADAIWKGKLIGRVKLLPSFDHLADDLLNIVIVDGFLTIAASILGCMLGWVGASGAVRRVEMLEEGASQIADGDFEHRITLSGSDEIYRTSITVNRMADALLQEREALERQARHDGLTSLLNRSGLTRRFYQLVRDGVGVSALHIDLDRFKMINDTRGHEAGDAVLRSVAARLKEIAPADALVARVGGDEFAMIVAEDALGARSAGIAERCIAAASLPIEYAGMKLAVGASIGIAHLPAGSGEADAERLLADADIALYQAKEDGRGRVALFDSDARAHLESQADLEFELALGLEYNEFVPYLQPQVDALTGEVIGAEILARWNSASRGLMAPGSFLRPMLHPELQERITYAVRGAALDWMAKSEIGCPPMISLNLAAGELARVDCAADLDWELQMRGLSPQKVAVEVLEDVVIRESDTEVERTIAALREKGHSLELDDFGTGNSGLANLVRLSVEQLKIDRSFISGIDQDRSRQAIVQAMISVGSALGIKVLAEGVETEAEKKMLLGLGCHRMQGYLFARPMSTEAFESWMKARKIAA